jgi:hypothetical protein
MVSGKQILLREDFDQVIQEARHLVDDVLQTLADASVLECE